MCVCFNAKEKHTQALTRALTPARQPTLARTCICCAVGVRRTALRAWCWIASTCLSDTIQPPAMCWWAIPLGHPLSLGSGTRTPVLRHLQPALSCAAQQLQVGSEAGRGVEAETKWREGGRNTHIHTHTHTLSLSLSTSLDLSTSPLLSRWTPGHGTVAALIRAIDCP